MSKPYKVGLAGLGTVGAGVVKILQDNAQIIVERAGRPVEIVSVFARSKNKDRGVDLSAYQWADDINHMANDGALDVVIEMIGGSEGDAADLVRHSLKSGKDVITANKALLAEHGFELAQMAETNDTAIAYEAAVAGGIPIIKALREGLAANDINSVFGILNGTCNYILSDMETSGRAFEDVLKEAQKKGYAEADPAFDVDGIDAAHKLVLLGALAFGAKPDFAALDITGIRHITADDIKYAKELGYHIRLLGISKNIDGKMMQSMEPCLVPEHSALGATKDVFNAILVDGDFVGQSFYQGRGAGEGPTASAIVADIIDLARGEKRDVFNKPASSLKQVDWHNSDILYSKAYCYLKVRDEAGSLAAITKALGDSNISIDHFLQKEHKDDGSAVVVLLAQEALMKDVRTAFDKVESLDVVLDKPKLLRIEDI